MIDIFINLVIPIGLVLLAMLVGTILEKRHFESIRNREHESRAMAILSVKSYPTERPIADARLVFGAVVISIDHFKRLLAGLRMIFGGELRAYCSLLDRARREAVLRIKA